MGGTPAATRRPPLVSSKLSPPRLPAAAIERADLVALLANEWRVALVVGPPGYGKTMAVRQWLDVDTRPAAWLSLDLLDLDTTTFWVHFLGAVRSVAPTVDGEPELMLLERDQGDRMFLAALASQVERLDDEVVVVLDDLSRIVDPAVHDGLATLVDRVGDWLKLVVTARADPPFPSARWRARGWLAEVREEHLKLSADEALTLAETFPDVTLSEQSVVALHNRTEGWLVGFQLALLSVRDEADADDAARRVAGSNRLLADYLVAEVLDRLPEEEREVALSLSVLEWFDPLLCRALLGEDAVPRARDLLRRRMFLRVVDDETAEMRFHPLFRELLEAELRWRDPARRTHLHRLAAEILRDRGELGLAHSHLVRIGDVEAAGRLVIGPAFELVDRGDRQGLQRLVRLLPGPADVGDAWMALDFAVACFFAGQRDRAEQWCDRADALLVEPSPPQRPRLLATRALLDLMAGNIERCLAHADRLASEGVPVEPPGPLERWMPVVAFRAAMAEGDMGRAQAELVRARRITGPESVVAVTVPALEAWVELEQGDAGRAVQLAHAACHSASALGVKLHHGVFETHVVAAWCHLEVGNLSRAAALAEEAALDAHDLDMPWNWVRVGVLEAEIARVMGAPDAALRALGLASTRIGTSAGDLEAELAAARAATLLDMGDVDSAQQLVARCGGVAHALVSARLATLRSDRDAVDALLRDRAAWPARLRLEGDVIAASARSGAERAEAMACALAEGAASGFVAPFLCHRSTVLQTMGRDDVARVHPVLATALWGASAVPSAAHAPIEALTAREHSILKLLPTHLSYAEIGERLFISVNTVKSGVKSVYRKLGVGSRAEAVAAATQAGLLEG